MAGVDVLFVLRFTSVRQIDLPFYLAAELFIDFDKDVLDGAMIVLAIYTINLCHPGRLEISADAETSKDAKYTVPLGDESSMNLRMDVI